VAVRELHSSMFNGAQAARLPVDQRTADSHKGCPYGRRIARERRMTLPVAARQSSKATIAVTGCG
jgi:hypothetical protein